MNINEVFIKPHVTEKSMQKASASVYSFQVHRLANKNQIKNAAEKLFKVEVENVKVIVRKGKVRRVGRKMKQKKLPDRRIAIIKVSKGKIDLFPQT